MPGPFFIGADDLMVPTDADRAETADRIYNWYQRNATSDRLVEGVSRAIGLERP
jgi:hypothetical protein